MRKIFWNKIFIYRKFILLLSIMVAFISYFLFLHFMSTDDIILKKDLTCQFLENVRVSDFVLRVDGEVVYDDEVDTSIVGIQKVEVQYRNRYGLIVKKRFQIEVLDVTAPSVVVANPYVLEKGTVENLEEAIFCADDYDDDVSCKIKGEYDLNQEGMYSLEYIATDHSGNVTKKDFVLKVVDKIEKNFSSKEKTATSFESVYQKYKLTDTLVGLDISKWQEEVDFAKLKEQGVAFVMLKIGGQKKIDGEIVMDPKFIENIKEAFLYDIRVGVYFYSYAKTEKEAKRQARWVIQQLKGYDISLPIVFDWENWNTYTKFHISFHTLNQVATVFLEEVEKNGYGGMLYSSKYYLENIWYREEYANIWLAYYTKNNDYNGKYLLWQVCNDGKIDGIDGYVDIDILYLSNR